MTSRERLLTALRGGRPDRVPVAPFGLGHLDAAGEVAAELIRRTDPLIPAGTGPGPFLGANIPITRREVGADHLTIIHLPGAELVRRNRRTSLASATVEFPFRSHEDAEHFLAAPYEPPTPDLAGYRRWCARVGDEALILAGIGNAVCLPASWYSPEDFCLAWADRPDLVAELVRVASARVIAHVEALCEAGVAAFRIIGGEYVSVQLGPEAFGQLVVPFDRALVAAIHRHGGIAYYHNHGKLKRYLPDLAEIGIDALDPLEAPPWGDTDDLGAARKAMGERVCLVGNLDDMEVLEALPVDHIQEIARTRLRQAGGTGFVLGGTASGTYTEKGARAFMAMVDVAEEEA